MAQHLEDADLPGDSLYVCLLHYLLLLQRLNCYLFAGGLVHAEPHLAEGAFPDASALLLHSVPIL